MKNHHRIFIAVILICIISLVYVHYKNMDNDEDNLTLYGNIEIRQVDLGFRVEGKIKKMLFEEGDKVKKGQLMAYLDDSTYSANYDKSIADVERNKAVAANALSLYQRHLPLCGDNTTSKQECDRIFNNKDESQAALKASIAAAKFSKANLNDTKIYAPSDGTVMTRVQEPGAVVLPSQPIYTIAKDKPVWIRAYIPEVNLANVKYGMKANVYTDTINPQTGKKREYTGWVGYISPVAEFTPKTVETTELRTDLVYRIRVYVYETDEYLRQGMPVTVKLDLTSKEVREKVENYVD